MSNRKEFNISVVISKSREEVWDTLFTKFGEISLFNPALVGSHFTTGSKGEVGCERVCNMDSKTFVKERIVKADTLKSFSVDIIDGNMPMLKDLRANFQLESIKSDQTKVILVAEYSTTPAFMGSLVKGMFRKKMFDLLVGLKYYLETGKPVSKNTYKPVYSQFKKLQLNQSFS